VQLPIFLSGEAHAKELISTGVSSSIEYGGVTLITLIFISVLVVIVSDIALYDLR